MTVAAFGKTSFAAGEVSPLIEARYDLANYQNGLAKCRNFLILAQGGITRRPPTEFLGEATGDFAASVLIPFQFSTIDAYVLEIGNLKTRLWRDGGLVETAPGVTYEFTVPWPAGDLAALDWVQSADILWITHGDHVTQQLGRTDHTAWTIDDFTPIDGPFKTRNSDETEILTITAVTGTGLTLTAPAVGFFTSDWIGGLIKLEEDDKLYAPHWVAATTVVQNDQRRYAGNIYINTGAGIRNVYTSPPVHLEGTEVVNVSGAGAIWRYLHSGYGVVKVTAVSGDGQSATVDVMGDKEIPNSILVAGAGTWRWSRGSWSDEFGFPSLVTLHEQRLVFARTNTELQNVWLSRIADFESFEAGADDDQALGYILTSGQVNEIGWMTSGSVLAVGATGEEFTISSGTNRGALTPETGTVKPATNEGSRLTRAARVDGASVYVSRDQRRIMEFYYDFQIDTFRSDEMTLLSDHLTVAGIKKIVWQRAPLRVLWILTDDGGLLSLTRRKEQQIAGISVVEIAGIVDDIAVVPTVSGRNEELHLTITRTIDSQQKRYRERMTVPDDWPYTPDLSGQIFLDSQISYSGPPVTLISGLDHLEAEIVGVVADGAAVADHTVSGGQIILADAASEVTVGLKFRSRARTLPIATDSNDGTSTGKMLRVKHVWVRYMNSLGGVFRAIGSANDERFLTAGPGIMDTPPPLQSGIQKVDLPAVLDENGVFEMETDGPWPMTITSITPIVEINR